MFDEQLTQVSELTLSNLFDFIEKNHDAAEILYQDKYEKMWQEKLDNLTFSFDDTFRLQVPPQYKVWEVVMGFKYYEQAVLQSTTSPNATTSPKPAMSPKPATSRGLSAGSNLIKAVQMGSYDAANKLLTDAMQQPLDSDTAIEGLSQLLFNFETIANKLRTPGYLLLANGYYFLARKAMFLNLQDISAEAYVSAYKNLRLALLWLSYSSEALHNAHWGLPLEKVNPFGFETIEAMMVPFESLLSKEVLTRAIDETAKQFRAAGFFIPPEPRASASVHRSRSNP